MTLYYYFGDDDEAFEYEVSHSDIMNDFVPNLKPEAVLQLARELYEEQIVGSPEELEFKEEYGIDNATFFSDADNPKVTEAAAALIGDSDSDDVARLMEDQISEYFRDQAFEAWEDGQRYRRSSLEYNGMSESDFI